MGSVLSSLVFRFGRIYLRACDDNVGQAAVLYTLCAHGKPHAWLPIFASAMPFLEGYEVLMNELSVRQVHTALTGLRAKSLIYQAHYIGKTTAGDPGTVVTDEGVNIETLPSSTRLIMSRHPFPVYFVQVNYVEVLRRAHPDIDAIVAAAIEKASHMHRSRGADDAKFLSFAFTAVYESITNEGREPFYTPSPLQEVIMTMLRQRIATM